MSESWIVSFFFIGENEYPPDIHPALRKYAINEKDISNIKSLAVIIQKGARLEVEMEKLEIRQRRKNNTLLIKT